MGSIHDVHFIQFNIDETYKMSYANMDYTQRISHRA